MPENNEDGRYSLKKKRYRRLFSNLGKHFIDPLTHTTAHERDYIEMRLPVARITDEFEKKIRNKIKQKHLNIKIREASENDIDVVKDLYDKSWRSIDLPRAVDTKEDFLNIFQDPHDTFLIASKDNVDCGFILLALPGKENKIGIIAGLGIIPEYQHMGLGTIMGIASWDFFKEKGVRELRCEVHRNNHVSYRFIKGLGFEEYDKVQLTRTLK